MLIQEIGAIAVREACPIGQGGRLRHRTFNVGTLIDCANDSEMTAERFLELINMTSVDGDSTSQLRIFEVKVQQLREVDTDPFKRKTISE